MLPDQKNESFWNLLFFAWLIALVATASALFIGEVMGQAPCNLCWFQRIFMFPLVLILGVALYRGDLSVWRYALPLSFGGLAVAVFHCLQYFDVLPENIQPCMSEGPSCSGSGMTLWGIVPLFARTASVAPQLSLSKASSCRLAQSRSMRL